MARNCCRAVKTTGRATLVVGVAEIAPVPDYANIAMMFKKVQARMPTHRDERLPNRGSYDRSRSIVAPSVRCLHAARYGPILPTHRKA